MKLSEFDYKLPKELIAQYPANERQNCRLIVLDRAAGKIVHRGFEDITDYFSKGDCLVLNDTKVIPARLFGKRKTGGRVELFLLEKKNPTCEALIRPSGRLKEGEKVTLESGAEAEVLGRGEVGRFVKFNRPIDEILESGHVPLPPYIDRLDEPDDRSSYQTVYAAREGATASPTAGLHFTRELLDRVSSIGVRVSFVTLHTNYGTFAPVKTDDVESHRMHREYFELSAETVQVIRETKKSGGKVFAVGTTTTRLLEYCASLSLRGAVGAEAISKREIASSFDFAQDEALSFCRRASSVASLLPRNDEGYKGYTDLFIYPGYKFKIVSHLITNFHLPKSTLMLLVSAFAGKDFIFEAYRQAIEEKYRFFSYGDAMLIL